MTSSQQDARTTKAPASGAQPEYDRAYRSGGGIATGVVLLVLAAWMGGDAVIRGDGRTPWLALAALLLGVPLIVAFTVRPAVFANGDEIRIRNPFRTITLPWAAVDTLKATYSTELFAGERKFQLWALPVSIRARKRALRQTAREQGDRASGKNRDPFTPRPRRRPLNVSEDGTIRSWNDQAVADLRELADTHVWKEGAEERPTPVVRWAYEVLAPSLAGAVVLSVLLSLGG